MSRRRTSHAPTIEVLVGESLALVEHLPRFVDRALDRLQQLTFRAHVVTNLAPFKMSVVATARENSSSHENSRTSRSRGQETQSPSPGNSDRGSKACCFCWCCCCSCSCLTVRDEEGEPNPVRMEAMNVPDPPPPEEIKSWSESFEVLMQCPVGRQFFREFLKSEYSEENMLFWEACENLKKETNPEMVEERARSTYEDYISILSPKEVSLDSRVRERIERNMVEPSAHTFDEAQMQIYTLMHRDSYPRFINSVMYRRLCAGEFTRL